jgi:prepilin peptidase CpaA
MMLQKEFVYPAAASLVALLAAVFDVKSRRIPNLITGPAILAGLLLHSFFEGWHGLISSFTGALLCGIIFLVFYLAGGMGAGDVKLITAVGALVGLSNSASVLLTTAIAGGIMAVFYALLRGRLKSTLLNFGQLAVHHSHQGLTPHPELNVRNAATLRLPYGLAIAAGACATLYFQGIQR